MSTKQQRARRQREITTEIGNRAYLVHRQWWRVLANRRRRAEIRELAAEGEALYQEGRKP